jgi:signal transduction histidine kinase
MSTHDTHISMTRFKFPVLWKGSTPQDMASDQLRAEADADLASRSILGVFSYLIIWLIIYFTRVVEINRLLLEFLGLMLAAVAVGRLYLSLRFDELYAEAPRRWRFFFAVGTISSAALWGAVCAFSLYYDRFGLTSVIIMLSTAGIAAGGIVTLAPAPWLGGAFVLFLLLPVVPFAFYSGSVPEKGIALLFMAFFIFMLLLWRRLHIEYWNALYGRAELKRARNAAEAANEAKSQFLANVSHELRTPLTAVIGALGLVENYSSEGISPQGKTLIRMAAQNSRHLSALINDLLDFEKLNAGGMSFDCKPLKLMPCLRNALELNKSYAERYHVSFAFGDALPEDTLVMADEQRLLQVMANLLSNASKYSPAGEKVWVSCRQINNNMRIAVRDLGPGIPETFRERVFEKFAQADNARAGRDHGTGLGLAITKAIVEKMGGAIAFESTVGHGATFYFDLPSCPSP